MRRRDWGSDHILLICDNVVMKNMKLTIPRSRSSGAYMPSLQASEGGSGFIYTLEVTFPPKVRSEYYVYHSVLRY